MTSISEEQLGSPGKIFTVERLPPFSSAHSTPLTTFFCLRSLQLGTPPFGLSYGTFLVQALMVQPRSESTVPLLGLLQCSCTSTSINSMCNYWAPAPAPEISRR